MTDGTNNLGLTTYSNNLLEPNKNNYGTSVGSARSGSNGLASISIGITTDSSKSGITARPSIKSLSAYVFYCIKY